MLDIRNTGVRAAFSLFAVILNRPLLTGVHAIGSHRVMCRRPPGVRGQLGGWAVVIRVLMVLSRGGGAGTSGVLVLTEMAIVIRPLNTWLMIGLF